MSQGLSVQVTVVIPQFNQVALTINCLRGLLVHHPHLARVLVVDDGSSPHELDVWKQAAVPRAKLIQHPASRGTTAAWNSGLVQVETEFVILLNNDVTTSGHWIDRLLTPLLDADRVLRMTGVRQRQESLLTQIRPAIAADVRLLEGWCLAARTADLLQLGGFDERFRLYFSDTDLQCRLLRESQQCLGSVPRLPVKHLAHRSTRQMCDRHKIWQQDRQRFLEKWDRARDLDVHGTH